MKGITIRFYEELNDFLPGKNRKKAYEIPLLLKTGVKDVIESQGVPHTEVDMILVNGESVGFSHPVRPGDYISVYPVFESLDITPLIRLRSAPLRVARFILDVHLGKLARYLRLLGFDSLYRNDYEDPHLAAIAGEEKRILLTRDIGLLKRSVVTRGYWVRSQQPGEQLREIVRRFDLKGSISPFRFCMLCNGKIMPVHKELISSQLPEATREYHNEFFRCLKCGKIYWQGTHYPQLLRIIEDSGK